MPINALNKRSRFVISYKFLQLLSANSVNLLSFVVLYVPPGFLNRCFFFEFFFYHYTWPIASPFWTYILSEAFMEIPTPIWSQLLKLKHQKWSPTTVNLYAAIRVRLIRTEGGGWRCGDLPDRIQRRRLETGWRWPSQNTRTSASALTSARLHPPSWREHS